MSTGHIAKLNLLKLGDVADFLKISEISLRRLIARRKIPFYKIEGSIRFNEKDVMEYLEKNRIMSVDLI